MLEQYLSDIYSCSRCGDCRESVKLESAQKNVYHVCFIKDQLGFDSYTAQGRFMILREIVKGKDIDEDVADLFYTCLECGRCKEVCISQLGEGIDVPSIVEAFRSVLTEKGFTRQPHKLLIASIRTYDNPWQMPRYQKAEWTLPFNLPERGDILFFAGCSSSLLTPQLAQSVVNIFSEIKKGGVLLYEIENEVFTVEQTKTKTEITKGQHKKPDIVIRITLEGVNQLMSCKTKKDYLNMYKYLYKETDHLDFDVKANMFTMARKGYVSWTKKAGLLSI